MEHSSLGAESKPDAKADAGGRKQPSEPQGSAAFDLNRKSLPPPEGFRFRAKSCEAGWLHGISNSTICRRRKERKHASSAEAAMQSTPQASGETGKNDQPPKVPVTLR